MKRRISIPVAVVLGVSLVMLYIMSCGQQQKSSNPTSPNLITFSKIDKAAEISTGDGVTIAVIDWLFDLSDDARQKYIVPASMVPGENIGELESWHGEWMAEIVHAIAKDAKIIPIRARAQGNDDFAEYLIKGIYYAADHGATAVSSSMGEMVQSPALDSAIAYAEAHGMIFVDVHPELIMVDGQNPRSCQSGECNDLIIHAGIVSVPNYVVEPESNRDIYTWAYNLEPKYKDGWGYSNAPPVITGVIALMK
ncbi:MAG: hypothetical protein JW763_05675, partial [candidate division Zixibacteria bacterium]|nr:hypothetical protein [candidate division Zixibacteria bacterium]